MKYLIIALSTVSFFFISCENNQKNQLSSTEKALPVELRPTAEKQPKLSFKLSKVYFGNIYEGDTLRYTYHFTNTGNLPLKIINVNASCGCTTPEWSKELVQPGEKGFVKIKFDSQGRTGLNSKTVTIYANTLPIDNQISFRVNVMERNQ